MGKMNSGVACWLVGLLCTHPHTSQESSSPTQPFPFSSPPPKKWLFYSHRGLLLWMLHTLSSGKKWCQCTQNLNRETLVLANQKEKNFVCHLWLQRWPHGEHHCAEILSEIFSFSLSPDWSHMFAVYAHLHAITRRQSFEIFFSCLIRLGPFSCLYLIKVCFKNFLCVR